MSYTSEIEIPDVDELNMAWVVPEYSTEEVDRAGNVFIGLSDDDEFDRALSIINNWRASHYFPLNTFATTLRRKAEHFTKAVVSQRVKRLRAIQHKLQKHTKKPIALSEMQDIGGCRVVLGSVSQVEKFVKEYEHSDLKHKLVRQDNYIAVPKRSGYRGVHLIYNYLSDRKETYNGHKIEIQFRTELQHAWATAVEIVGFFRRELLKSSEGDPVWKQFFKLMAAEIAFAEKSAFGVPDVPGDRNNLRDQLCRCAEHLGACDYLRVIGKGVEDVVEIDIPGSHYFLLELDTSTRKLKITGYRLSARQKATWEYAQIERAILGSEEREAVLVSAKSMADLKRAYINYFLDMRRFIELAEAATK
jgi:ppGpp synthetase/RelA/SpoT-type nucleotidyltranferase